MVALFARAWIEIYSIFSILSTNCEVALFARAWIEILVGKVTKLTV